MPFCLKDRDISADMAGVRSALIVACRFCPAASVAARTGKPYVDLFRSGTKTPAYESYIEEMKASLAERGIKADVFPNRQTHHSVVCMWPAGPRKELSRRAAEYDAVIVLGCDAALETAKDAAASHDCRVVRGMDVEGLMNVIPSMPSPGRISLEVTKVIRVLEYPAQDARA